MAFVIKRRHKRERDCTTHAIDIGAASSHTHRVIILLVCSNEDRLERLKAAVHSAGFRTISARGLDEAWTRTDFFDFSAVVITTN